MQTITAQSGDFQTNAIQQKIAPQMNSQGEVIEEQAPQQAQQQLKEEPQQLQLQQPQQQQQKEQPQQQAQPQEEDDDFYELGDTALAPPKDGLMPPTDDSNLVHEIISCGHVLKSTHDLARWSEKTGARRVNLQESIDAVSDLAINLEPNPNRGGGGAAGGNRRGRSNNNAGGDPAALVKGLFNEGGNRRGAGGRRNNNNRQQQQWKPMESGGAPSEVIQCWPVLKSTHDQAQLSEKRGRNAVNKAGAGDALDELALNQGNQQQQRNQGNQQQGQQRNQQQQSAKPASLEGIQQMFGGGAQEFNTSQQSGGQSGESQILHSWPVLKSTHDQAMISEKRGPNAVNQSGSSEVLEEMAQNGGVQAGGSNLQSGQDTQAGSHIQMDNQQ